MIYYDKLIFELSARGRKGYSLPANRYPRKATLPPTLLRAEAPALPAEAPAFAAETAAVSAIAHRQSHVGFAGEFAHFLHRSGEVGRREFLDLRVFGRVLLLERRLSLGEFTRLGRIKAARQRQSQCGKEQILFHDTIPFSLSFSRSEAHPALRFPPFHRALPSDPIPITPN